jgi:transcription termination/antitermination protein NusG
VTDQPNQATDVLRNPPGEVSIGQQDSLPAAPVSEPATMESVAPLVPAPPAVAEGTMPFQPAEAAGGIEEPQSQEPQSQEIEPPVAAETPAGGELMGDTAVEPVTLPVAEAPAEAAAEPAAEVTAEPITEPAPVAEAVLPPPAPPPAKQTKAAAKAARAAKAVVEPVVAGPKSDKMDWYILKVQSNREESIREGLLRRVAIAGLDTYVGEVIVPTEKVTEFKGGKKRVTKRKLYPGYLVVQMEINDDTWFLVRDTPGIGDFTGASGHPTPMLPHEVARILSKKETPDGPAPKLKIGFTIGERVKIKEGTFESFEGEVEKIDETNGRVTVMINIFGRSTPVELEYWQIEAV